MTGEGRPLPLSFGADQLVAAARQVQRTVGGGDLDLHHWLAALLKHDTLAEHVLVDVDRTVISDAVARRLDEGDLDFPFPKDDALLRASQRARRSGHDVVTTDDLGGAIAAAAAALIARLASTAAEPPTDPNEVVEFYPEGLLHKFGFGDGDMLCDLIEEHSLGVDHQDLLIAVVEHLVVPRLDQNVETYTLVSLHNPIRAATIDGVEADINSTLSPQVVEIPVADIVGIARTLPPDEYDE